MADPVSSAGVSAGRDREEEIEAVAEALYGIADALAMTHARRAIAALDRVRAEAIDKHDDDVESRLLLRLERDGLLTMPAADARRYLDG